MCRLCDDYMEEVRQGACREAGLGHVGGRVTHGAVTEERSDEAISNSLISQREIASLRSQ